MWHRDVGRQLRQGTKDLTLAPWDKAPPAYGSNAKAAALAEEEKDPEELVHWHI